MAINREMHKEEVVHTCNGILLSHKRNEIGSFIEVRMDLEAVMQSELSQKKKKYVYIYHISHICGIKKNGIDDRVSKAEIETQT